MLNNRKSMLALLLGMSLAVTFPVGVDASDKGADTAQETMQDSENTTDSVQDTENTESTESEPPQPETRATEAESETTADTKAEETQESEEIQTETQQSEPDETDPEDTKEKDQDLDEKAAQREKEKEKAKDKKDSSKSEKDAMSEHHSFFIIALLPANCKSGCCSEILLSICCYLRWIAATFFLQRLSCQGLIFFIFSAKSHISIRNGEFFYQEYKSGGFRIWHLIKLRYVV